MIVTLTANPSLDRTITLEGALRPGEVQSASSVREDAGGKGINVARVVAAAGVETIAVLPLADDDPFDTALRVSRLPARRVPITGHVRANLTVTDPAALRNMNVAAMMICPAALFEKLNDPDAVELVQVLFVTEPASTAIVIRRSP